MLPVPPSSMPLPLVLFDTLPLGSLQPAKCCPFWEDLIACLIPKLSVKELLGKARELGRNEAFPPPFG